MIFLNTWKVGGGWVFFPHVSIGLKFRSEILRRYLGKVNCLPREKKAKMHRLKQTSQLRKKTHNKTVTSSKWFHAGCNAVV